MAAQDNSLNQNNTSGKEPVNFQSVSPVNQSPIAGGSNSDESPIKPRPVIEVKEISPPVSLGQKAVPIQGAPVSVSGKPASPQLSAPPPEMPASTGKETVYSSEEPVLPPSDPGPSSPSGPKIETVEVTETEPVIAETNSPSAPAVSPPPAPEQVSPPPQVAGQPPVPPSTGVVMPPRKPKPKFLRIIIILLAVIALGGGGYFLFQTLVNKEPVISQANLVYWGLWEDESIMEGVIADWEREHPNIKIEYRRQKKEEYRERLQSALARDEGPDLFRFHNTWVPMLQDELSSLPSSVMSVAEFEETFYPVAGDDLKIGASVYGLPLEIDTLALFYNEEIFRTARRESEIIKEDLTWDELRRLASEMTVRNDQGEIQIAGIAMGGAGNIDHWPDILGLMMLQNRVDLAQPEGKLAEDALKFYNFLSSRDKVWDYNFPNSTLAFAGEKVAMYFGYSWDVFEIIRVNPDLKFRIVPVPQLPGRDEVAWASYWVEGVAKRSKNQPAAWQFLKYLTSKEVMARFYQSQTNTRLFGEPYSRRDLAAELETDPWLAPFIKQASYAQSWYLCSRTFDNGINEETIKYFEDALNSLDEGKDAAEVLGVASRGVAQILSRYQVPK